MDDLVSNKWIHYWFRRFLGGGSIPNSCLPCTCICILLLFGYTNGTQFDLYYDDIASCYHMYQITFNKKLSRTIGREYVKPKAQVNLHSLKH